MDRALRDGYELHRAALAHGFDVTLLPRQVMEVQAADGSVKTSFSHGVPQQTTLAAVTYAQDVRMRRDMIMRAGYAIPTGATFSMGGGKRGPYRYAHNTLGFPVVVKPAVGDNTVDVMSGITDRESLQRAIEYFHTPPAERPGHTRAAYALTELREPGVKDGRIVVPPGYRFLVEKQVPGKYLRFVVLAGEVINALLCPDGPWKSQPEDMVDVTGQVHHTLNDIAVGMAGAIPGIALAAIDIVTDDYTVASDVEKAQNVEYSERPWLAVQHKADPLLAENLANRILEFGVGRRLREPNHETTVNFTVDGAVHPDNLLDALRLESERLGLGGRAEVSDSAMGHIAGTMQGHPADIAWIMESMLDVGLDGQRAMLVEQRHTDSPKASAFQTRGGGRLDIYDENPENT